ncbi:hypothetical protein SPLC1_S230620 [Arthrospira platensis C1]|nr:hypothetical protein SPLC1_S230620 [Arthrospira platensis C1]
MYITSGKFEPELIFLEIGLILKNRATIARDRLEFNRLLVDTGGQYGYFTWNLAD